MLNFPLPIADLGAPAVRTFKFEREHREGEVKAVDEFARPPEDVLAIVHAQMRCIHFPHVEQELRGLGILRKVQEVFGRSAMCVFRVGNLLPSTKVAQKEIGVAEDRPPVRPYHN